MAWEWVTPVAGAVTLSVGTVATYLTARGGRAHAETVASAGYWHAEAMAREERAQKRRGDTYVEILTITGMMQYWAAMVRPVFQYEGQASPPPLPGFDQQNRLRAIVATYGSPQVRKLVEEYLECVRELVRIDQQIETSKIARSEGLTDLERPSGLWSKLEQEHRPATRKKFDELSERINQELA